MESFSPSSTVVLTTHERSEYFYAALGDGIDVHLDTRRDPSLNDMLYNISVSGGKLVVLDEDYFSSPEEMLTGLEQFIDTVQHPDRLSFIVVCSRREAGDALLAHLVTYCQIYNIVYGKRGVDIATSLGSVINAPRTRSQVAGLAQCMRWQEREGAREREHQSSGSKEASNRIASLKLSFSDCMFSRELVVDMNRLQGMSIQFRP